MILKKNDKILYKKYKTSRYNLFTIININKNNKLEVLNEDKDSFIIDINKYIKKYIIYEESKIIYCNLICKKNLIFGFHCNFCNSIHKHNKLGNLKCKCLSQYSPYSKYGYILKLKDLN